MWIEVQYGTKLECLQSIRDLIQAYTGPYKPIQTLAYWYIQQYLKQYRPLGWDQHILCFNTCQYLPNTYQYIPQNVPTCVRRAKTSVLHRNSIHAITYQYIPLHTNTYQIHSKTRSVQHTGFHPAYMYWHVSWYVCIGMYCASIWHELCNDISQY